MRIKGESVTKKITFEYQGKSYLRISDDGYITWMIDGNSLFEYNRSRQQWQQRINRAWIDCNQPEIETEYIFYIHSINFCIHNS